MPEATKTAERGSGPGSMGLGMAVFHDGDFSDFFFFFFF